MVKITAIAVKIADFLRFWLLMGGFLVIFTVIAVNIWMILWIG